MIKYNDRVRVVSGYYKGNIGIAVDCYSQGIGHLEDTVFEIQTSVQGGYPCNRQVSIFCSEDELEVIGV